VTDIERLSREYRSSRSLGSRLGEIEPPRSHRAGEALRTAVRECVGPAISIGGGPLRVDPRFVNLNLAPFPNVDLVGDAHCLPISAASVGLIHCEAVLEHLEQPDRAVSEMLRVLRPGGYVFAATPFLQVFHGYPDHFQNFTLAGHCALFVRSGFEVVDSGACVGPAFALVDLVSNWAREHLPGRILSRLAWLGIRLVGRAFVQLDRVLLRSAAAHVLASTTFVLARKPRRRHEGGELEA
jgi:SAM-dependent methyltransferase